MFTGAEDAARFAVIAIGESRTFFSVGDAGPRGPVCAEDEGPSRRLRGVLRRRDNYRRW